MRHMSRLLGFDVKNIYGTNISINEDHWNKLKPLLNIDLKLKEIKFDFTKNLGTNAFTAPIKPIRKSGELAEFIGIMLGDGNIYRNQVNIAFDKRHTNYMNYVESLCFNLFGVKFKRKFMKNINSGYLYFYNQVLVSKLLELGLKRGNKIENQLGIPNWIKDNKNLSKRCIKGLIDTDGCIYICKREGQKYVKFTNHNKRLMNDFKEITKNLGYSFAKANKTNTCLYRKEEVASFIKDIKPLKSIIKM